MFHHQVEVKMPKSKGKRAAGPAKDAPPKKVVASQGKPVSISLI